MPLLPNGPLARFYAEEVQAPVLLTEDLFEKIGRNINGLISSSIYRIDFMRREPISAPADINTPIFGYHTASKTSVVEYIFFFGRFSGVSSNCSINLAKCPFNNLAAEVGLLNTHAQCSSNVTGHFSALISVAENGSTTTIYSHNFSPPSFPAAPIILDNELVFPKISSFTGPNSLYGVQVTLFLRPI